MNDWINLHALWEIVVFGLLAGAGLPALFAVGLRFLAMTRPGSPGPAAAGANGSGPAPDAVVGGSTVGMVLAGICFVIVVAAIGWGIYFIVLSSH
ncbi:MAG TPA: hypothetical protein VGI64_22280 [Streptosporangiaceae bacterium]|jgi:hypothetical protein